MLSKALHMGITGRVSHAYLSQDLILLVHNGLLLAQCGPNKFAVKGLDNNCKLQGQQK